MTNPNSQQLPGSEESALSYGVRGVATLDAGDAREAAALFQKQLKLDRYALGGWYGLALAMLKLMDVHGAEVALRQVLLLDPSNIDAHLQLATLFQSTRRLKEAEEHTIAAARLRGVAVFPCLKPRAEARILVLESATLCNLPSRMLFDHDRFETISAAILPPDAGGLEMLGKLPPYDILFNCVADADNGVAALEQVETFCRGLSCPVLNPPTRLHATRRDLIPSLLGDIPGLVVPETRRVRRKEVDALAQGSGKFDHPILIRPIGSHGGLDLERIDDGRKLAAYLSLMPWDDFYLTDYREYRNGDGYWRKYRLIFVDREVFPYHLAIGKKWLVHYWRADMEEAPWMKEEEEAFLADYRSVFSGERGEAVREVARRMDLDYCGLDCSLTPDGRVLLFEANATMLVHLDEPKETFPYKHRYVPRIFDAMVALVNRRLRK